MYMRTLQIRTSVRAYTEIQTSYGPAVRLKPVQPLVNRTPGADGALLFIAPSAGPEKRNPGLAELSVSGVAVRTLTLFTAPRSSRFAL
ncbi:hypothetical protein EVAR_95944_1 [Eumeta japonica]|uniref:Uncharacterized protein n=1 Tax=Eumeta variegata TaxID=151549 RepID=A0A4C1V8F6_EUMVA|nr:hypothetical protein EVAR_95944_1 [Eumeta japonica]